MNEGPSKQKHEPYTYITNALVIASLCLGAVALLPAVLLWRKRRAIKSRRRMAEDAAIADLADDTEEASADS